MPQTRKRLKRLAKRIPLKQANISVWSSNGRKGTDTAVDMNEAWVMDAENPDTNDHLAF